MWSFGGQRGYFLVLAGQGEIDVENSEEDIMLRGVGNVIGGVEQQPSARE